MGASWNASLQRLSDAQQDRRDQRNEAKRLLGVLDGALEGRDWIAGEYSIADMAIAPWLAALDFYGAKEVIGFSDYKNVVAYLDHFLARPAVQKGRVTPPRD